MTFSYCPNIYTGDLPPAAVRAAVKHALKEFPNESCGAIIGSKYVRFKNESETPENHFEIKDSRWFDAYVDGRVRCLVHSHNDWPRATVEDQTQQQELGVPSLVINLKHRSLIDCILLGGNEKVPLEGRPFFYGIFDCLALVSDYMLETRNIVLPNPPHDWEFWAKGENPIEQMIDTNKEIPFTPVNKGGIQEGDVLLYNIWGTRYINHMGVCCSNNGLILHHFLNTLSGKYPVSYGRKYLLNERIMRPNI